MAEDNTGEHPPAKRMRPMPKSVYFDPDLLNIPGTKSSEKKSFVVERTNWQIWIEDITTDDNNKTGKLFLESDYEHKLADKFKLTIWVFDVQLDREYVKSQHTFDIENNKDVQVLDFDIPQNAHVIVYNFQAVPSCISSQSHLGIVFNDPRLAHDISLHFRSSKLYCNKVVLAQWSNYFDRLFFSETSDKNMKSCDLSFLNLFAVRELLHDFLHGEKDFSPEHVSELSIRQLEAVFALELQMIVEKVKSYKFEYNRSSSQRFKAIKESDEINNIYIGLELAEKYGLDSLKTDCATYFREKFSAEKKKKFFDEKSQMLKCLDIKSLDDFMNKGFGRKIKPSEEFKFVFDETNEAQVELEPYEKNINKLTDVTLIVGDQKLKVHKDIQCKPVMCGISQSANYLTSAFRESSAKSHDKNYLAFFSPYFDRLFFGGFSETGKDEIELKEIGPQEFSTLIDIIYPPREKKIDASNVVFLLKLADRLQFKAVMIKCGTFLAGKNDDLPLSLIDTLELADTYNLIDAQHASFTKIKKMDTNE